MQEKFHAFYRMLLLLWLSTTEWDRRDTYGIKLCQNGYFFEDNNPF